MIFFLPFIKPKILVLSNVIWHNVAAFYCSMTDAKKYAAYLNGIYFQFSLTLCPHSPEDLFFMIFFFDDVTALIFMKIVVLCELNKFCVYFYDMNQLLVTQIIHVNMGRVTLSLTDRF